MSRKKLLDSLRQLQQQRRSTLRRLTKQEDLAVGTVSVVKRKCGNPKCRCARGLAHPQTLFLFMDKEESRRRCKLVRRSDEDRIHRAGERYRQFRKDLRQLRAIDQREKQVLMALMEARTIRYK